jgi:hypothetical protein
VQFQHHRPDVGIVCGSGEFFSHVLIASKWCIAVAVHVE